MHLRRRSHRQHRQAGEGPRLVRQRVGLLQPTDRHYAVSPARRSAAARRANDPRHPDPRRPRRRRAASGCSSAPTSTSRSTTGTSPTTSASAPRCRRSTGCTERGATVVCASHLGRPKGAPDPKYSMAPVRGAPGRAGPGCRAAREPALRSGRGGQRRRRSSHKLIEASTLYVNDAFGAVAPRPRLDRRAAADAAVGDGAAAGEGGRRAARPAQRPQAPVRRRARRRQDLRQARRGRGPARASSTRW